jgi:arylsulfatase
MDRITRKAFLATTGAAALSFSPLGRLLARNHEPSRKPNVVLILGDDLGYAELGCYGQQRIRTPRIDALAREGVRFTDCYSGSPVCAPSRCVLLTGKHSGHAFVRDNLEIQPEGQLPLPAGTATLPLLLRSAGYTTGLIGKWWLGYPGSKGDPQHQGFDHFFGYNCQRYAHNHYPAYLWRNGSRITLDGNSGGPTGAHYAPDMMEREAFEFISRHKAEPFFLLYATTIPHLALQVPEDSRNEYSGRWDDPPYDGSKGYVSCAQPRATYAGMVTRFDRSVGRILDHIDALSLGNDTIVIVASDNGATFDFGGYDPLFFRGTGQFRAAKGSLYEGGVRVPLIMRWPGQITSAVSTHVCAFQDVLPTVLELAGQCQLIPHGSDGISFFPALMRTGRQRQHEHLYFEFPGYGGQQMVRTGSWSGVRQGLIKNPDAPLELYDLSTDIGQRNDVARDHPGIVRQILAAMQRSHTPSREFPFPPLDAR